MLKMQGKTVEVMEDMTVRQLTDPNIETVTEVVINDPWFRLRRQEKNWTSILACLHNTLSM